MRFDKTLRIIFSSIGKQTATSKFNQALSLFCSCYKPILKFYEMFIGSSGYCKYTRSRKKFIRAVNIKIFTKLSCA